MAKSKRVAIMCLKEIQRDLEEQKSYEDLLDLEEEIKEMDSRILSLVLHSISNLESQIARGL